VVVPIPAEQTDRLTLGSSVQASIVVDSHSQLVVPRGAVQLGAEGAWVFKVENGKAVRVPVKVELMEGAQVAVSGALQAGDTVVTIGSHAIDDGMSVREPTR